MFEIKLDQTRNIIFITLKNIFTVQEAKAVLEKVKEIIPKLKKGFKLVNDLSLLERIDSEARTDIEKTMDLFNKNGISTIIRIIPDANKDIGFNILSLFHYSKDVTIHTYESFEEALKYFL